MSTSRAGAGVGAVLMIVLVLTALTVVGGRSIAASSPGAAPTAPPSAAQNAPPSAAETATRPLDPAVSGPPGAALALLATLPVKGRAPMTGYDRSEFGPAWFDEDRNGCDTRNDVLRRDLTGITATGCRVLAGTLHDPYTRAVIRFQRGQRTSTAVQIDHVVALGEAWQTGAQRLTAVQRRALANDPVNLFAVDGPTNQSKGDGDAATWLPPNKSFRCSYVAHQVAVKAAYHLWVTRAERTAIDRVLRSCPDQKAPRDSAR